MSRKLMLRGLDIMARPRARDRAILRLKRGGLSPVSWITRLRAQSHMQIARGRRQEGRQTVKQIITTFVGLDIHKGSIAIAVANAGREAPRFIGTVAPGYAGLCKALRRVADAKRTLVVYEAGPCGYGYVRYLKAQGWNCEVIAPARITRSPAERRIKTDKRDALLLAKLARSGDLASIAVPDARHEAIRDLSRAREDATAARHRARLQLKAMLLRHGKAYHGKTSWTQAHERHLAAVRFDDAAQEIAFNEYRQAAKDAHERVERLTQALREQSADWRMKPVVDALMCMRGLDFVGALTFVAEIGDLTRFPHPKALMAYLGLVPSEYSSGESRRQGPITKAGNKHARRILVEAAWCYRFKPQVSRDLEVRQQGQPKAVRDVAWRAQLRLTKRFRSLIMGRKIHQNRACVAIARELAGFIWDAARQVKIAA
jgi:transposase